ncbi:MAG: glycosyltransferase 4 family protein [Candidatus Pacearchaeota archaeon]|jgi:UDP-N-acetylglucosamine--dolichyl-phosphate N-acetylglucosaminephosphotransferase
MDNLFFLGVLFFPILMISFLITFIALPVWIKRAHAEGLTGKDIHKIGNKKVAEGGGMAVLVGVTLGALLYIALKTFLFKENTHTSEIFALLGVLFFASIVGIVDDLLGWKRGLSNRTRIILLIFSAIPLMVLNAGDTHIFGINLGILFPLLIVPIGIVGATSTFNFLAGYNGLEASQGILILGSLAIVTFLTGNPWLSVISMCMVVSLIAFYLFNKYPAKVFPGDILTYSVGAMIACIAILGKVELIAIFFFIPYILETILKIRGRLKKESFGKLNPDGSLNPPYEKNYGLEHIAIRILKKIKPSKKAYEWEVPLLINAFQIIVIGIGFIIFF